MEDLRVVTKDMVNSIDFSEEDMFHLPLSNKGELVGCLVDKEGRLFFEENETICPLYYVVSELEIKEGDCYVDCPQHDQQGKDNSICANCKWNYLI